MPRVSCDLGLTVRIIHFFTDTQPVAGPNSFDFSPLETYLSGAASRQKHAVLRFILDYPQHQSYVPQYLINAGLAMTDYTDMGNQPGQSQSPDYSSPLLISALESFVAKLGELHREQTWLSFTCKRSTSLFHGKLTFQTTRKVEGKIFDVNTRCPQELYDGDPRIGFIQVGLLGFWGECVFGVRVCVCVCARV